jgi:uncharacterized protein YecE (DUF72 family)
MAHGNRHHKAVHGRTRSEPVFIGTAGWQLPPAVRKPDAIGPILEQYSALFNAVEINSTHYKHHLERTYVRWAASVPEGFRFAVKMHRSITHEGRFTATSEAQRWLQEVSALGDKLGPVLIQLPPSLAFREEHGDLLRALREIHAGPVVIEPRHPTWASASVSRLLREVSVPLVGADPPLITEAFAPGDQGPVAYFRLHGSPRVYWSAYSEDTLTTLAQQVAASRAQQRVPWVIFDNTAAGEAAPNALRLQQSVSSTR